MSHRPDASASRPRPTLEELTNQVNTLVNADLKNILKNESCPVSGVKNVLQNRVIALLNSMAKNNDVNGLERMSYRLTHQGRDPGTADRPTGMASAPYLNHGHHPYQNSINGAHHSAQQPQFATRLRFRPNPFYEIHEAVSITLSANPLQQSRDHKEMPIKLGLDQIMKLKDSSSGYKVFLYCTSDDSQSSANPPSEISFPQQVEVRCNAEEVRSNFKGIKNKPGSTRPVDISPFLRKQPGFSNILRFSYALTTKRFFIVALLVRKRSVTDLLEVIKQKRVISKENVIREIKAKANDPDIVATSTKMSLRDPVTLGRMNLPCRTTLCRHNQCFDGEAYLQLQEQAPLWTCPICDKQSSFEGLAVDQYVQDILQNTPTSAEQVTVEPDATWHFAEPKDEGRSNNARQSNGYGQDDSDDDEDFIEIVDPKSRLKGIKTEAPATPASFITPSIPSREPSVATPAAAAPPRAGQKRKSEVVDLTLSDDDEPPRPAKRPNVVGAAPPAIMTNISNPGDSSRNGYHSTSSMSSSGFRPPSANPVSFQMSRPSSSTNNNNHNPNITTQHTYQSTNHPSRGLSLPSPGPGPPSLGNYTSASPHLYSSNHNTSTNTIPLPSIPTGPRVSFGMSGFPSQPPRYTPGHVPRYPSHSSQHSSRPATPQTQNFTLPSPIVAPQGQQQQSPNSAILSDHEIPESILPFLGGGARYTGGPSYGS